jgi:UDP-N-acetylglucosamine transferase subunit ALG13
MTGLSAGPQRPAELCITVTVGTDHHPFDRLIYWINDWLRRHPELLDSFFVQSGAASVVPDCAGSRFLEIDELNARLDSADVIVCHGGPGSIAEAWERSQLPIVVPRLPELGEIVDDHQVDFCRRVAKLGRIRLAQSAAEFAGLLDEAARDHTGFHAAMPKADVDAAVARFGELVDGLVSRSRRRRPWIGGGRLIRHQPATGTGNPASRDMSPEVNTDRPMQAEATRIDCAEKAIEERE